MNCLRCQGKLVNERIFTEVGTLDIARCVYCGDIIDRMILHNRFASHPVTLSGARHRRG